MSEGQSPTPSTPQSHSSPSSSPPQSPIQQLSQSPRASVKESISVLSEFVKTVQSHQHAIVRGVTEDSVETKSSMTIDLLDVLSSKNVISIETIVKTVARIETPSKKKNSRGHN